MASAWAVYASLERFAGVDERVDQVISLHWALAVIEILVVIALWQAFNRDQLAHSPPLIQDNHGVTAD
jgi:hypothetical protein